MNNHIKTKILRVILSISIGALALLSVTSIVSVFNLRGATMAHSNQLGATAAENSQTALESQARLQLMSLAEDKAALTDEKLLVIQNHTKMTADIATHIYTYKTQYLPQVIDYLQPDQVGTTVPHIRTAAEVSFNDIRSEVYLAANVTDMLRQITVTDIGVNASYIGGETGYFITVDKASSGPKRTDYDARTRDWYIGAKTKDRLFWTDVFTDSSGRGASISCAMPFYDLSNGEKVFKGVAGSGMALSLNVNQILDSAKIGQTGYAFLLNGKGQVIFTPKSADIVTDEAGNVIGEDYLNSAEAERRELARRMLNRESGLMELELDGKTVYAAYHPITTIDWSMGVVVPVDEIIAPALQLQQNILSLTGTASAEINRTIVIIILILFVIIAVVLTATIIVAIRLSDSLTAPIISLTKGAVTISGGDLSHRFNVQTGDEIEVLANSFNQMIGDIQTITVEKQRINSELSVASDIQNDMLPRIFPKFSSHKLVSLFAKMEPAKEVGGDFFDFFYLDKDETKVVFVIADVSGKGVPAALFMVIAKTLIKQQMLLSDDPANALEQVNKILCEDNPRCMFVTTLICTLDLLTGQMRYANGGHNPPLIARAGEPYQFMQLQRGVPPGMMEESRYKLSLTQLQPGDKLYLYTDGVNEAMNKAGEQFGNERFLHTANLFRDLPPEDFDGAIRNEARIFVDGAEQSDDITTVAIAYTGNKE